MRTLVLVVLASCLAWSVGEYVAFDSDQPVLQEKPLPNSPYSVELSHDNGNITTAWVYLSGAGTYAGVEYNEIPPSFYAIQAIKYYVWSQGWPDNTYQGFGVACWKMEGGMPGAMIWPDDGIPEYNPNTGGNWIVQNLSSWVDPDTEAPEGFVVGIAFLYSYPANDAFGVDETGPSQYDWAHSASWTTAPYGVGAARALCWSQDVEPSTLGTLRALYR